MDTTYVLTAINLIVALVFVVDIAIDGKIDLPHTNIEKLFTMIGRKLKRKER